MLSFHKIKRLSAAGECCVSWSWPFLCMYIVILGVRLKKNARFDQRQVNIQKTSDIDLGYVRSIGEQLKKGAKMSSMSGSSIMQAVCRMKSVLEQKFCVPFYIVPKIQLFLFLKWGLPKSRVPTGLVEEVSSGQHYHTFSETTWSELLTSSLKRSLL